jgi:hypothetical protein
MDTAPTTRTTIGIDMKKSLSALLWTLVFIALLLGIDQFFLRIPASVSPHREAQTFYLDFRGRLLALGTGEKKPAGPLPAPGKAQSPLGSKPAAPAPPAQAPAPAAAVSAPLPPPSGGGAVVRYIYVDQAGDLHFADSLQEVPARYRGEARPLSR